MAGLQRLVYLAARRNFSSTSRASSWFGKSKETDFMPDPVEHATGLEKKEMVANLKGIDDPFDMHAEVRGPSTKDKPHIVTSPNPERHVGCICDEDSTSIRWMVIRKGDLKRCYCGHWFKLEHKDPFV